MLLIFTFCILIFLLGIFSPNPVFYFFGYIFFLAGYFSTFYAGNIGLVFLFSHGMTGLCFMEGSIIFNAFTHPLLSDGFNPIILYFIGSIIILILAIILCILIVLKVGKFYKKNSYYKVIPLVLYFVGLLISVVSIHVLF